MITFLYILHIICCLGLILIVLLQAGKGAGLASTFGASAVESALGAEASDFLKKGTSVMAVIFMLTSLSLAFLTARKSASVMKGAKPLQEQVQQGQTTRQVTPEGDEVIKEVIPGLEKKSKKELQQVLKEITEKLPLGQKKEKAKTTSKEVASKESQLSEPLPENTTQGQQTQSPPEVSEAPESQPVEEVTATAS